MRIIPANDREDARDMCNLLSATESPHVYWLGFDGKWYVCEHMLLNTWAGLFITWKCEIHWADSVEKDFRDFTDGDDDWTSKVTQPGGK